MVVEILLWTAAVLLVGLGMVGLVIPAIPGPPLLFCGLLCAAWAEDFVHVAFWTLLILGLLALIGVLADFVAGALGAKKVGASRESIVGATLGAIIGLFFGLPGLILGPFLGAALGELSTGRTVSDAGRAGVGATIGLVVGTAAKLAVGIAMLATFAFVRFT